MARLIPFFPIAPGACAPVPTFARTSHVQNGALAHYMSRNIMRCPCGAILELSESCIRCPECLSDHHTMGCLDAE